MGGLQFSGSRGDVLCRTMTFSRGVQTPDDTLIYFITVCVFVCVCVCVCVCGFTRFTRFYKV